MVAQGVLHGPTRPVVVKDLTPCDRVAARTQEEGSAQFTVRVRATIGLQVQQVPDLFVGHGPCSLPPTRLHGIPGEAAGKPSTAALRPSDGNFVTRTMVGDRVWDLLAPGERAPSVSVCSAAATDARSGSPRAPTASSTIRATGSSHVDEVGVLRPPHPHRDPATRTSSATGTGRLKRQM
jgi:hypothetical protein